MQHVRESSEPPSNAISTCLPGDAATVRQSSQLAETKTLLSDVAYARSGDKGIHANIGVIARRPNDFELLRRELTSAHVAGAFGIEDALRVRRFELPNLSALNFVLLGVLDNPLRCDSQGKALGQILLEMPISNVDR